MAKKKKLNKKLALIVLVVVGCVAVIGATIFITDRYRDPQPILEEGRQLDAQADEQEATNKAEAARLTDPKEAFDKLEELNKESVNEIRSLAKAKYQDAYKQAARTKNRELQIATILEIAELYRKMGEHRTGTLGAWRQILKFAPEHVETQRKVLDFVYESGRVVSEIATPGSSNWSQATVRIWGEVEEEAEKLTKILSDDPYGFLVQAHAILEQVDVGTEIDPEERIATVESLLDQAKALSADDILGYKLQARLARVRATRTLEFEEELKQGFADEAERLLRLAVEKHPESFEAYENLYLDHLYPEVVSAYRRYITQRQEVYQAKAQAKTSEIIETLEVKQDQERQATREAYENLDNVMEGMIDRFPLNGVLHFYQSKLREIPLEMQERVVLAEDFNPLIESLERAIQFEEAPTKWYLLLANLYARRAYFAEDRRPGLETAYATLRNALYQPGATDLLHARSQEYNNNRLRILLQLVQVGADLLEMEDIQEKREKYQEVLEDAIAKISDTFGPDETQTRTCKGLLALALGRQDEAIRLLYSSRKDLQAVNQSDPWLDLKLFYALRNTNRVLAAQFGLLSIRSNYRSEALYLELMQVLSGINDVSIARQLNAITLEFEKNFGSEGINFVKVLQYRLSALSRILQVTSDEDRVEVLSMVDEALARFPDRPDDFQIQFLKAILKQDLQERLDALVALSADFPAEEELVSTLYNYYIQQPDNEALLKDSVAAIVAKAVQMAPENARFRTMQLMLNTPNQAKTTPADYEKIALELKELIHDPVEQNVFLGAEYVQIASLAYSREDEAAAEQYRDKGYSYFEKALESDPKNREAMSQIMQLDMAKQDWSRVQERILAVQEHDPDSALSYEAQLAYVQKDWDKAIEKLQLYIEEHPVSIQPYVQLASAYEAQGNLGRAVETARLARSLDPTNRRVNRTYAILLYQTYLRNQTALSKSQLQEMVQLTNTQLMANADDVVMLKLAAEFYPRYLVERDNVLRADVGLTDAQRSSQLDALYLQIVNIFNKLISIESENVTFRTLLAGVHEGYASLIDNPERKEELALLAEQVYQKGLADMPDSVQMKTVYGQYISARGRVAEGIQVIKDLVETSTGPEKQAAQIRLAQFYMNQGDVAAAEQTIRDILADAPDYRPAKQYMVDIYSKQKNYDAAVGTLEELRKEHDDKNLMMAHIELLIVQNKSEEAETILNQLKEEDSESTMTMLIEAKLRLFSTKYDEAVALCDQIIEQAPDMMAPYDLKARALYYNRQPQLALECVGIVRSLAGAESTQGRLLAAQIYQSNFRYSDAVSELKSAIEISPKWMEARDSLIKLYRERNQFDDLFKILVDSIKQYPNITKYYSQLSDTFTQYADALIRNQQVETARKYYADARAAIEKALEISLQRGQTRDYDQVYNRFLGILLKIGEFDEIISLTEKGLADKPDSVYLLLRRAEALRRLNRSEEALAAFEKALDITADNPDWNDQVLNAVGRVADLEVILAWTQNKLKDRPDWVSLHELLARIYAFKGDKESQLAAYLDALKYANTDRTGARVKVQLAIIYGGLGQNDKAIQYYEEILALDFTENKRFRTSILNNLAYLLMQDENQYERAVAMAREAYQMNPLNPEIMDTYASTLIKKGQFQEAESIIRQAIQIKQREGHAVIAEFHYRLALALHGSGQNTQSRDQLDAARERLELGQVIDKETTTREIEELEKTLNDASF
jgi:tetratricopeptide (TPR) repeat protein